MAFIKEKEILILLFLYILVSAASDIFIAGLKDMSLYFNCSYSLVSYTISSYGVGFAIFSLLIGQFADQIKSKTLLIWGVIIFAACSLAIVLSPSIYLVIALRVIQPIGAATVFIVARLIIKQKYGGNEQIRALAFLLFAAIITPGISPVIGAYLIELCGWKSCFALLAILSFVLMPFCHFFIKQLPLGNHSIEQHSDIVLSYFQLIRTKENMFKYCLIFALSMSLWTTLFAASSYIYLNIYKITPQGYSLLFIATSFFYFLGNRSLNIFQNGHRGAIQIIAIGIWIMALAVVCVGLSMLLSSRLILSMLFLTLAMSLVRYSSAIINPNIQMKLANIDNCNGGKALSFGYFITSIFGAIFMEVPFMLHDLFATLFMVDMALILLTLFVFYRIKT